MIALDDHVDALEDVALRVVLEGEDALEAEDVGSEGLGELLDPREEELGIERRPAQRDAGDRRIMDVVVMRMLVVVIVAIVVMVVLVMVMVVIVTVEEVRIERQDAVEIEGAAVEHAIERDGAALGAVDDGVRD